jgi:beta-galactosidase
MIPDWQTPSTQHRQRLPGHFLLHAGTGNPWLSLDGNWSFRLFHRPEDVPPGFHQQDEDEPGWRKIPVPSNWQLQDTWDKPVYCNMSYLFPPPPPRVPEENPTGCYRRVVEIPPSWKEKRTFLRFDSVDSAFYVWMNGSFVGYSQDSRLVAEFDVSDCVRSGQNLLAVQVMRFCDGSYLECQDFWRMSGIQGHVSLYAKPQVHLRDYKVRTPVLPEENRAVVEVDAYKSPGTENGTYSIRATLTDEQGGIYSHPEGEGTVMPTTDMYAGDHSEKDCGKVRIPVPSPRLWSAETPTLYDLKIELMDEDGVVMDSESCRIGLREVAMIDNLLCLNGRPLTLRGVNRHHFSPDNGRAVTEEEMVADIRAMKQLNFNAVRCSHYPNPPRWYELCSEYGLYVIDEANLETHGVMGDLSRDPEWAEAYLMRGRRMVQQNRNHTCIIAWSLGNESFDGPHHAAMAAWIRREDPTRVIQYESGNPGPDISDLLCPMYPELAWVKQVLADPEETRPFVFCEYAYSKGNAGGGVQDFWDLVNQEPRIQGAFLWDWADKALWYTRENGERALGYGGDLGETFDYDGHRERRCQVLNGIVSPELDPHPAAWEVMRAQSPVTVEQIADGTLGFSNHYHSLGLDHLKVHWHLLRNGEEVKQGELPIPPCPPGTSVNMPLPVQPPANPMAEEEIWLNLDLIQTRNTGGCEAGHRVYWTQIPLRQPSSRIQPFSRPADGVPVDVNDDADQLRIQTGDWTACFCKDTGDWTGFQKSGQELFSTPMRDGFMRPPTCNDWILGNAGNDRDAWEQAGLDRLETTLHDVQVNPLDHGGLHLRIHQRAQAAGVTSGIDLHHEYFFLQPGIVEVHRKAVLDPELPPVARVGCEWALRAGFTELSWYGAGPHESYPDRKNSTRIGLYHQNVAEGWYPFLVPQETGGHEDTRWFSLHDPDTGSTVEVRCAEPLHFSALPYSGKQLRLAGHLHDLVATQQTYITLDAAHQGLGGRNGWMPNVPQEFKVLPATYTVQFQIRFDI